MATPASTHGGESTPYDEFSGVVRHAVSCCLAQRRQSVSDQAAALLQGIDELRWMTLPVWLQHESLERAHEAVSVVVRDGPKADLLQIWAAGQYALFDGGAHVSAPSAPLLPRDQVRLQRAFPILPLSGMYARAAFWHAVGALRYLLDLRQKRKDGWALKFSRQSNEAGKRWDDLFEHEGTFDDEKRRHTSRNLWNAFQLILRDDDEALDHLLYDEHTDPFDGNVPASLSGGAHAHPSSYYERLRNFPSLRLHNTDGPFEGAANIFERAVQVVADRIRLYHNSYDVTSWQEVVLTHLQRLGGWHNVEPDDRLALLRELAMVHKHVQLWPFPPLKGLAPSIDHQVEHQHASAPFLPFAPPLYPSQHPDPFHHYSDPSFRASAFSATPAAYSHAQGTPFSALHAATALPHYPDGVPQPYMGSELQPLPGPHSEFDFSSFDAGLLDHTGHTPRFPTGFTPGAAHLSPPHVFQPLSRAGSAAPPGHGAFSSLAGAGHSPRAPPLHHPSLESTTGRLPSFDAHLAHLDHQQQPQSVSPHSLAGQWHERSPSDSDRDWDDSDEDHAQSAHNAGALDPGGGEPALDAARGEEQARPSLSEQWLGARGRVAGVLEFLITREA
ncbi:hypothetical protein JCM10213_004445 [Rhodosporidiobolus nylandii]